MGNFFLYIPGIIFSLFPFLFLFGPAVLDSVFTIVSVVFFIYFITKNNYNFFKNILFDSFLCFFLYLNAISFFALDQQMAFGRSLGYLRYLFFIIFLYFYALNNLNTVKYFIISSTLVSLFVILDLIYQMIFGHDIFGYLAASTHRFSGPFGEELIAGQFLYILSLPTLFFSIIFCKNYWLRNFTFIILTVLIMFGIFLSGQRTAFFNYILSIFLLIIFIRKMNILNIKIIFSLIFSSIIVILIFFQNIFERFITFSFNQLENIVDSSYAAYYESGIIVWLNNIYFGVGLKNYRINCQELLKEDFLTFSTFNGPPCATHPHNIFLEILSETGIVGLLLLAIVIILFMKKILSSYYKSDFERKLYSLPFMITLFPLLLPLLPSGSFFTNAHSVPFWIYMGVSMSLLKKEN